MSNVPSCYSIKCQALIFIWEESDAKVVLCAPLVRQYVSETMTTSSKRLGLNYNTSVKGGGCTAGLFRWRGHILWWGRVMPLAQPQWNGRTPDVYRKYWSEPSKGPSKKNLDREPTYSA
ncbi:hypothetical protein ACE6H2_024990 [Prunus campanulata]